MNQSTDSISSTDILNTGWTFAKEGDAEFFEAKVPGNVHTDLLRHSKIPQPFYRENEAQLQWIDKENWIYRTVFNVDSIQLKAQQIELIFDGLDTYAEVKLNHIPILKADNMFRSWEVDVTRIIRSGKNELEVKFISPIAVGLQKLTENGYPLPAVNDQSEQGEVGDQRVSVFTRKAPYHYGWDWGPRFVTSGIWKPISIRYLHNASIQDAYIKQTKVNESLAELALQVEINSPFTDGYKLVLSDQLTGNKIVSQNIHLEKGMNEAQVSFQIDNPQLWWPAGYGEQHMYHFKLALIQGNKEIAEYTIRTGLREIALVREGKDNNQSFYFQVNGKAIYVKGANYIPNDNFLTEVSDERYKHILQSAADANMNMLRVWGGGIYENDIFYQLCDEYGLLVWQDFMFACSMYPNDTAFFESVKQEATDNIKRLRNHPSIALWCGNNEIDAAWCKGDKDGGWGWKENYTEKQQAEIWHAYDTMFHHLLPDVVNEYHSEITYWPSSPLADWGKSASYTTNAGDMHYWGVWHGGEPFENFDKVKARFMSEYGFQSFPEFKTINEFTIPQDWDINSDVLLAHQRSPIGNQKIKEYMQQYYPVPNNFKEFLYIGQLLQAYSIQKAITAHRIDKPHNMGTLYWQLNDCWPGPSWSGIDYYGNWKALHYKVRNYYKPTILSCRRQGNGVYVYVLNDDEQITSGVLEMKISSFEGNEKVIFNDVLNFTNEKSNLVKEFSLAELENLGKPNDVVVYAELLDTNAKVLHTEYFYLVKPKELNLPHCTIKTKLKKLTNSTYQLTVSTDKLAKDVCVSIPETDAALSTNFIDIMPESSVEIEITTDGEKELNTSQLVITCLNEFIEK